MYNGITPECHDAHVSSNGGFPTNIYLMKGDTMYRTRILILSVLSGVFMLMFAVYANGEIMNELVNEPYRPGIDPEAAVRLMLAGLFQGIIHDRRLMREAQVNLAIRWFAGYRLNERLPHHSSLTKLRQRWGAERFKSIFLRTVKSCGGAGLISGEMTHIDAKLIRADVSWESLVEQHAERVVEENDTDNGPNEPQRKGS